MNILCFPFHDYKTALKEGFRTRDTHLYSLFQYNESIDKVVIVNRPTLALEVMLGRKTFKTEGRKVFESLTLCITEVSDKTFVIDTLDLSILGPVF